MEPVSLTDDSLRGGTLSSSCHFQHRSLSLDESISTHWPASHWAVLSSGITVSELRTLLTCKDTLLPFTFTHTTTALTKQPVPTLFGSWPWPPISRRTCMWLHSSHLTVLTVSFLVTTLPRCPVRKTNNRGKHFSKYDIKYFLHRWLTKELDYWFSNKYFVFPSHTFLTAMSFP